jgi:hypothetical protein
MRVFNFPKKTDDEIRKEVAWLHEGFEKLGIKVEREGFVQAWVTGDCKMIIEAGEVGTPITSAAILAHGKKWTDSTMSATILELAGDRKKIVEYCCNLATAFQCTQLFYEALPDEPGETFLTKGIKL